MMLTPAHGAPDELLDAAPFGFVSFTDEGQITLANRTALDLLGYGCGELEGRPFETILTIGARVFFHTHFFPLVKLQGRADEIYLILRCRDGSPMGVLMNAVRRERGAAAYDCAFMRVREREKFEAELLRARRAAEEAHAALAVRTEALGRANHLLESQAQELELHAEELQVTNDELMERTEALDRERAVAEEANRAKSEFLAVMSHELRTPLNAIGGYVELLEMGLHGPVSDAQREALLRIDRSQRHLLRLINDVLNLARIEAGHVEYRIEELSLAEVVAAVAPMVEPQLAAKRIAFSVDVPAACMARGDRDKLQQVVLNLLGNAVKFTPEGGRVRVDAVHPAGAPDRVLLRVADTGPGIPRELLGAIFDPFVQVDASHTRRTQGTGLGLAISRDLARGMGAELGVESVVGQGSTFTLALLRARPR